MSNRPAQAHIQTLDTDHPFGFSSWLAWVAATTLGWVVAEVIYRTLVDAIVVAALVRGGVGVGVFMAVFQALVLRRHLRQPAGWILASGIAAVLGPPVATVVIANAYSAFGIGVTLAATMALTSLAVGLFAGAMQWLVLRRPVPRAAWWIPASALAMGAGMPLAGLVAGAALSIIGAITGSNVDLSLYGIANGLAGTTTYAAITGYALFRLFISPSD